VQKQSDICPTKHETMTEETVGGRIPPRSRPPSAQKARSGKVTCCFVDSIEVQVPYEGLGVTKALTLGGDGRGYEQGRGAVAEAQYSAGGDRTFLVCYEPGCTVFFIRDVVEFLIGKDTTISCIRADYYIYVPPGY